MQYNFGTLLVPTIIGNVFWVGFSCFFVARTGGDGACITCIGGDGGVFTVGFGGLRDIGWSVGVYGV